MKYFGKKVRRKVVAIILAATFLFPLVYNPVHYLFIEHFHTLANSSPSFDTFHKSCMLDDFQLSESTDLEDVKTECSRSFLFEIKPVRVTSIFVTNANFTFLLRAPPIIKSFC